MELNSRSSVSIAGFLIPRTLYGRLVNSHWEESDWNNSSRSLTKVHEQKNINLNNCFIQPVFILKVAFSTILNFLYFRNK